MPYAEDGIEPLIAAFREAIADCGLDADRCAVLCRASALVETISGGGRLVGSGAVKTLARVAALRDVKGDFHRAFRLVAEALEHSLLESPPEGLASHLADPRRHPAAAHPALVWNFVRSSDALPGAHLRADTDWLAALRSSVRTLLDRIADASGLQPAANLAMRLSGKALPPAPVSSVKADAAKPLRVDTVHGAKGETLDAVLYIVTKGHLERLLAGTATEIGRIGYVAVTRPRDLLWVGVPAADFEASRPALEAVGLVTRVPISSDRRIGRRLASSASPRPTASRAHLHESGRDSEREWPRIDGCGPVAGDTDIPDEDRGAGLRGTEPALHCPRFLRRKKGKWRWRGPGARQGSGPKSHEVTSREGRIAPGWLPGLWVCS